jgi:hypothetical protein
VRADVPIALAAFLCCYLGWESWRELNAYGAVAILSPAILASSVHFYLSYSLPMLGTFFDDGLLRTMHLWTEDEHTGWLIYAMVLVCLSAVVFWRGYRCSIGLSMGRRVAAALRRTGLIRAELRPNLFIVFVLIAASIAARMTLINLGIFGYSSDRATLYEYAAYRQYLEHAAALGLLALFLIAVDLFNRPSLNRLLLGAIFIADLLLEIGFGFLSGFKSQVISPAIVVGVAYFLVRGRIPIKWVLGAIILMIAAYAIVERFREIRHSFYSFESTSALSILDAVTTAASTGSNDNQRSVLVTVAGRAELITPTIRALQFSETALDWGSDAPAFLSSILLAPLHAFVPRLIWPDKPANNAGIWFYTRVYGGDASGFTSVGMGPISYFYFAGGVTAVVVGFFLLGMFYRALFMGFGSLGAGGWIVYLVVAGKLALIPSEVGAMLAGVLQLIPLAILVQATVLRTSRPAVATV